MSGAIGRTHHADPVKGIDLIGQGRNAMLPDIQKVYDRPSHWRTAGILTHADARRFVGRLRWSGIDHHTSVDGRFIRVSVETRDLEQALELRPDVRTAFATRSKSHTHYMHLRMLVSIPVGAFLGTLICHWIGGEYRFVPALTGIILSALVELTAAANRNRRDQTVRNATVTRTEARDGVFTNGTSTARAR